MLERALEALDRVGSRAPTIDLWASFNARLMAEGAPATHRRRVRVESSHLWRSLASLSAVAVAAGACVLSLELARRATPLGITLRTAATGRIERTVDRPFLTEPIVLPRLAERRERERLPWSLASPLPSAGALHTTTMPSPVPEPSAHADVDVQEIRDPWSGGEAELAALSSDDLGTMADALMMAPQAAAQAQVAIEVITLAEEMVRLTGESPNGSENPS
jgi:hypothetical protein